MAEIKIWYLCMKASSFTNRSFNFFFPLIFVRWIWSCIGIIIDSFKSTPLITSFPKTLIYFHLSKTSKSHHCHPHHRHHHHHQPFPSKNPEAKSTRKVAKWIPWRWILGASVKSWLQEKMAPSGSTRNAKGGDFGRRKPKRLDKKRDERNTKKSEEFKLWRFFFFCQFGS